MAVLQRPGKLTSISAGQRLGHWKSAFTACPMAGSRRSLTGGGMAQPICRGIGRSSKTPLHILPGRSLVNDGRWNSDNGHLSSRPGRSMTIPMERRLLYIPVLHIDTNLINARQKLDAVNRLEKWYEDGVVLINMSSAQHG